MLKSKLFFILFFISINVLFAQGNKSFSSIDFGVYGGINFYHTNEMRGDFLVEFKSNLFKSTNLQVSAGYLRSVQPNFSSVSKYSQNTIDTTPRFFATKYDIINKHYDIFPVSLGVQFIVYEGSISPYISINAVYNFMNSFIETSPPKVWSYNSIDEIPDEFKESPEVVELPTNSLGILFGIGANYNISGAVNFDIRYLFKYDNKIINTHHFIMGIYF